MDGTRTQAVIQKATGFNQGHPSTLVKQLNANKPPWQALTATQPKLAISIPEDFFEGAGRADATRQRIGRFEGNSQLDSRVIVSFGQVSAPRGTS